MNTTFLYGSLPPPPQIFRPCAWCKKSWCRRFYLQKTETLPLCHVLRYICKSKWFRTVWTGTNNFGQVQIRSLSMDYFFIIWTCPKSYIYLGNTCLIGPKWFCSASPALALNCVLFFEPKLECWMNRRLISSRAIHIFFPIFLVFWLPLSILPLFYLWISHVKWIIDFLTFFKNTTFDLNFRGKISSENIALSFSERWKKQSMSVFLRDFLPLLKILKQHFCENLVKTLRHWFLNAFSWATRRCLGGVPVAWLPWQPRAFRVNRDP
jgi:hypothetical protein